MTLDQISNPYTLNIFCDASIQKIGKSFDGCYGAVAVVNNTVIDEIYRIVSNTTNNNAEIKGVRAAISLAIKYKAQYENINIFSDSQISVLGIRERFPTWHYKKDGLLYGTTDTPIKSQNIFVEIVSMIKDADLKVIIWHQKGHVKNSYNSLVHAQHVFAASNRIRENIDLNLIRYISYYNNIVDSESRSYLYRERVLERVYNDPIEFYPSNYKELVNDYKQRNLGGTPYEKIK